MLRPGQRLQSMQFKVLEAKLGLRMEKRHGKQYYTSQLKPHHKAEIEALEGEQTLLELVNAWLERMPFLEDATGVKDGKPFFQRLEEQYVSSLVQGEEGNAKLWKDIFVTGSAERS